MFSSPTLIGAIMRLRHISFAVLFLTVAVLIASCNNTAYQSQENKAFQRMNSSGVLRAGYISVPPKLIVNPNSKAISGVMHDALEAAAKNMGVKIDYVEEVSWGTMVEAVESGRVDVVVAGVWPSSARARRADFSLPIFYSAVRVYVKEGDTRFDGGLQAVNSDNIKIATLDGEMSAIIAATDFPNAKTVSLPQTADAAQVLLLVAQGKADITFMEPAIALEYGSKNPGQIKEVPGIRPVRLFGNTYLVSNSEPKLRKTLDIAIEELVNSGTVDKIIDRYEAYPSSMLRPAFQYRAN
jgi:polar amino acid transport system substrate-binding protein